MGCYAEDGSSVPCVVSDGKGGYVKNPASYTQPIDEYNQFLYDDDRWKYWEGEGYTGTGWAGQTINPDNIYDSETLLPKYGTYDFGDGFGMQNKWYADEPQVQEESSGMLMFNSTASLPNLPNQGVNPALYELAWSKSVQNLEAGINDKIEKLDSGMTYWGTPITDDFSGTDIWGNPNAYSSEWIEQEKVRLYDQLSDYSATADYMTSMYNEQYKEYVSNGGITQPLSETQAKLLVDNGFDDVVEDHYMEIKNNDEYAQWAYQINRDDQLRQRLYDEYAPTLAKAMWIWQGDKNPQNQGGDEEGRYFDKYLAQEGINSVNDVPDAWVGIGGTTSPFVPSQYDRAKQAIDGWIRGERMTVWGSDSDAQRFYGQQNYDYSWGYLPTDFYPDQQTTYADWASQFDEDAMLQWDEFMEQVDEKVGSGGGGPSALLGPTVKDATREEAQDAMKKLSQYQENPKANKDVEMELKTGGELAGYALAAQSNVGSQQIASGNILAGANQSNFGSQQALTPIQGYVSSGLGAQKSAGMFGSNTGNVLRAAEGGPIPEQESLLGPAANDGFTEEDAMALEEVLGEGQYAQLESAMAEYPVVEQVADMAIYQADGYVPGPPSLMEDPVPARLTPGEYVFSKKAVEAIGQDELEMLHEKAKAAYI